MKLSGAEILCQSLLNEGVEVIFGYPGGAIMPVYDALLKYPKLHHVLVRHEQGAAHAAEGYARATGKPGVCLVTSGPGATNIVTGLADAYMDSVPIVCISGQVVSSLIGLDAFQEADVVGITGMITKHNDLILNPSEVAGVIKEAFHLSKTGRPGPVMVDFTKDAQLGFAEYNYPKEINLPGYKPTIAGNIHQIKKAADLINQSKKPLLLIGHGMIISNAQKQVLSFLEKTGIPAACTLLGLSGIPVTHKNYVGMLGMHGNLSPNVCTNEADLLIGLGLRFDDRVTSRVNAYGKKAKIIHIDIDPAEIGKNVKVTIPIVGDIANVLNSLNPLVKSGEYGGWYKRFKQLDQIEYEKVIEKEIHPQKGKIKMGEVMRSLSDETEGNAIIVSDVGQNQMISARYYQYQRFNSYITSGGLGTMGFALPAGIGAKYGKKETEVWAVMGDGGFQMKMQEMATLKQENLNLKIAILNNNYLGMVRQWQHLFFNRKYSEVFLQNPDFIKLAEAFGIPAVKVEKRHEIIPAIKKARKSKGPFLLEFVVETEANIFPMIVAGAAVDEVRLE